jgi:hypothetical protein
MAATKYGIPPSPAVPIEEGSTRAVSPVWYTFFVNLFNTTGAGQAALTLGQLLVQFAALVTQVATLATQFAAQSITLALPSWLTVSGSPIVGGTGTFTVTGTSESQNQVLASPNGSAGAVAPRALVGADLPNPAASTLGGVRSLAAVAHNFVTSISTAGQPVAAQPVSTDLSDTLAPASFSPTDQSGAGLVFTSVSVQYAKTANQVWMYGALTYPTTVDGSNALISVPIPVPNHPYAQAISQLAVAGVTGGAIITLQNTSEAGFITPTGVQSKNSDFSGKTIVFSVIYPAA